MDEEGFKGFLRRGGRSQSAIKRCIVYVREFETYIQNRKGSKKLGEASPENLEDFGVDRKRPQNLGKDTPMSFKLLL